MDLATIAMRARLSDIDTLGHINNGVYLTLADMGRYDLLVRSGVWDAFKERGWYPVVANATISYRRSLELNQRYVLETKFIGADERAIYIEQRFTVGGEIYARLFIRGRFLKRAGGIVTLGELADGLGVDLSSLVVPEWVTRWATDGALPAAKAAAPSVWN